MEKPDTAHRLSNKERAKLVELTRAGASYAEAARAVGCAEKTVQRLMYKTGGLAGRAGSGRVE